MRPYRTHSLERLLGQIVSAVDAEALCEFHDHRTIFSFGDSSELLFAEYLSRLKEGVSAQSWGRHAQAAYDLTVDKFSHLPEGGGIDCRNYFRGTLKTLASVPMEGELQRELALAEILQRLVYRHFELSLKECCRSESMTRYEWWFPAGTLSLLMPRTVSGSERSRWLQEHVPDVDPRRANERERVQAMIDEAFGSSDPVSFDDAMAATELTCLPWEMVESISCDGLAKTIAAEKAACLLEQRPAIQALGATRLHEMVLRIFDALADGDFRDGEIAQAFGLSKATFSRFAGSQWNVEGGVPDLWKNTAKVLAAHDELIEVAHDAGVWSRVVTVIERT
jgi:hypothetical protein